MQHIGNGLTLPLVGKQSGLQLVLNTMPVSRSE
ncbi:MAG: hypothetical protein RL543_378 [Pseudomonadota bacterium]|jgi:hypothetical protein